MQIIPEVLEDYNVFEYDELREKYLVDVITSEDINCVAKYKAYNKLVPKDITIDDIKLFRTWLAKLLLDLLSVYEDTEYETLEMLKYYASEMTDDTIKHLSHFTIETVPSVTSATTSSCSCSKTSNALLQTQALLSCDSIALYRKALYNKMVDLFSGIDFWSQFDTKTLSEIKKYIDGIITADLPLTSSQYISDLYDCGCLTIADSPQKRLMQILINLSKVFSYIIDEETKGHKNFIADTLHEWASKLYEIMRW